MLRRLDALITALESRIAAKVAEHPLLAIQAPWWLPRLLGKIGAVSRLRGTDGFAALAGVASIPASSGQTRHMRLTRGARSESPGVRRGDDEGGVLREHVNDSPVQIVR